MQEFSPRWNHVFFSMASDEQIGITPANLSILKTGKAKAIRFSTLEAICKALDCQPGDVLEYRADIEENESNAI